MGEVVICFCVFLILQGLYINSIYELCRGKCVDEAGMKKCSGNLFYEIKPLFFEGNKDKFWAKPLYTCVRCMASVHGTYTFWIAALLVHGFSFNLILVWLFDIVILVSINWLIFKKI